MGRVIVPIANHPEGLHVGHQAVLDFAKTFPGTYVVKVIGSPQNWLDHLTTGKGFVPEKRSPKMVQDIIDKGFMVETQNAFQIEESWRAPMAQKAAAFVSLYKDVLLTDDYVKRATAIVMGAMAFQHSTVSRNDIIIKGPEVASFFQKSAHKLGNSADIEIFPNMIKSPITRIREQSSINKIPIYYHQYINRLRYMIDGVRDRYKIGKNDKLVEELNDAYVLKTWKVKDILVFEGGFIPGRLEITQFIFPSYDGSIVIDEIDYER